MNSNSELELKSGCNIVTFIFSPFVSAPDISHEEELNLQRNVNASSALIISALYFNEMFYYYVKT